MAAESYWRQPVKWNRNAEKAGGGRRRVFCASLADVFEAREELTAPRIRLLGLIKGTPHLDWLLLTKRPEDVKPLLNTMYEAACRERNNSNRLHGVATWLGNWLNGFAPKNIWLGTSIENQQAADERIPALLGIPAAVRFLSCEPLLGPVEFSDVTRRADCVTMLGRPALTGVDWVIVGGESGSGARPCDLAWIRSLIGQCQAVGVPCFVKQLGKEVIVNSRDARRIDDREQNRARLFQGANDGDVWRWNPRDAKGGDIEEWPEDLHVREFPEVTEVAA
jgi:protein gp37